MSQPHSTLLLATRSRAVLAAGVTAFLFALTVRSEFRLPHTQPAWLFPTTGPLLHGWWAKAASFLFYGYLCCASFWFIRRTEGRERLWWVGWLVSFLVWPVEMLLPQWAVASEIAEIFGVTLALIAAISLAAWPSNAATNPPYQQ